MYTPEHFELKNPKLIEEIVHENSFATLVTRTGEGVTASHLPLLWHGNGLDNGIIQGHMARNNSQWHDFALNKEVLAIFTGCHGYISPTWYSVYPAVPTWNYTAVHIYGAATIIQDPVSVRALLKRMVAIFDHDPSSAWPKNQSHETLITEMVPNIVTFEIAISRIEAKAKLSQNRKPDEQQNIVSMLKSSTQNESKALAHFMETFFLGPRK